jgi:hypothetical protein
MGCNIDHWLNIWKDFIGSVIALPKLKTMLAQCIIIIFFHTRALRIEGVVVETSKRAQSTGNWSGSCPF